jgi:hypothetical protein
VPAVQKVRETGARVACINNMKQVALAIHSFHNVNKSFPTYNGIFPAANGSTLQSANTHAVYGSWIVHILPYLDQGPLYDAIASDVSQFTNTGAVVTQPGGTLITPGTAAYWSPPLTLISPAIPATYNLYVGSQQWVTSTTANGYTISTLQWVPARNPDPGTNVAAVYDYSHSTLIPAVPAVYGPPGAPVNGYVGIWNPVNRANPLAVLRCPSDPSYGYPSANGGLVYANTAYAMTGTNYLANWNMLSMNQPAAGYAAAPQKFANVTDGLSNTILLAEAYSFCEGRGRTALLAWHINGLGGFYPPASSNGTAVNGVHNFGLTYSLPNNQIDLGSGPVTVQSTNGYPNPTSSFALNFYFQIRPDPVHAGAGGCDSMTVQSGHDSLNIALGDGSVRSVTKSLDPNTWAALLLPTDGTAITLD